VIAQDQRGANPVWTGQFRYDNKVRFKPAQGGVCEGVLKRSFLTCTAKKASGKKDRFTDWNAYVKR